MSEEKKRGWGRRLPWIALALLVVAGGALVFVYLPRIEAMAEDGKVIMKAADAAFAPETGAKVESVRHQYTDGRWVAVVEWRPAADAGMKPEALGALMDRVWTRLKPQVPERYQTVALAVPRAKKGIEISTESGPWSRYEVHRVYGKPLSDEAK